MRPQPPAILAALALSTAPVFAQPPPQEHTAAAVMKVERAWLAAIDRHDAAALARILGSEFIDSDSQGEAITRERYLDYFRRSGAQRAPPPRRIFADTQVRFEAAGEIAIVTGLVISRAAAAGRAASGPDAVRHSRFTDVFIWRDGRWQAVTGQETHFIPPPG